MLFHTYTHKKKKAGKFPGLCIHGCNFCFENPTSKCMFVVVLLSWHYPWESWMLYRRYTDHAE